MRLGADTFKGIVQFIKMKLINSALYIACFYLSYVDSAALFGRVNNKDGTMCNGTSLLFTKGDMTVLRCAKECKKHDKCQRYYYQSSSELCVGCTSDLDQETTLEGSICYEREHSEMAYLGCFTDSGSNRVLILGFTFSVEMTNELCFQYCVVDGGFIYSGTQEMGICFCGNQYDESGRLPDSQCTHVCLGDSKQKCGGGYKNSIYYRLY